ncbi:MAG TPA: DUF4855 domain-containing protein [Chthonomonadaceae bacterium]|nr:DUF4855 domain-containing protein [Chthonomonadaceae bacterium]
MAVILAGLRAGADYISPRQAGFHHCALIYDKPMRGVQQLMPFVARSENGKAKEWLFDAFLFLIYTAPRSMDTLTGPTIRSDWQYQLDRWFASGRDLAALDAAVEAAGASLGAPPSPREVILAIPYLNPSVKDFGDVEGNGKSADLSTLEGREAVLQWYLGEARRRFAAAHFKHLHLWGFYWMREDMPSGDEPIVRQAAHLVHAGGERFLWIPYFTAPGWDHWRAVGFDVALMQSVYAFTFAHHGQIRRNRLAVTATLARRMEMGAEIECGDIVREPKDRAYFRCYLADGAAGRLGYQQAATAYYLGDDLVEQMLASPVPEVHSLYAALADYVAGRKVPNPDPPQHWSATPPAAALTNDLLAPARPVRSAETRFAAPTPVRNLDVFLDDPDPSEVWTGSVQVEGMLPGASEWSPGGWAVRTGADPIAERWQVLTVPVGQTVIGLRVTCRPFGSEGLPRIRALSPEIGETSANVRFHKGLFCPYQFLPAPPATYPDDGRKLTDGILPEKGFLEGKSVGWLWTDATVRFDLGRVRNVSRIEVYCQGGGFGAVNWPAFACAVLSAQPAAPSGLAARGPFPFTTQWTLPDPVVIGRVRKPDDVDGHLPFVLSRPARARYVTLFLKANAWLMLTEVRIIADGVNVAPEGTYTLSPPPTPNTDPKAWADDGRRLTDGVIADQTDPQGLTGWDTGDWRDVVVDLGYSQPIRVVTAWSLYGGFAAIYAPSEATADTSDDGRSWQPMGKVSRPAVTEDGKTCHPLAYRIEAPSGTTARYLRVRVKRAQGWAMLSEIEVE